MRERLGPDEALLVGRWNDVGGQVRGDEVCARIEYLVTHVLERVADSSRNGAWETLFRDPADGRLWERTYPESHLHGGGPPMMTVVSLADARAKYDLGE